MTVSIVSSPSITNTEAGPQVFNRPEAQNGRIRIISGTMPVLAASTDEVGDIIRLARIPADAVIVSLEIAHDDLDTNGVETISFDLGLYDLSGNAKDADVYIDGSANTSFEDAADYTDYILNTRDKNLSQNRVFEDAGDTAEDHDAEYYLALTVETIAATGVASADISWRIGFVID